MIPVLGADADGATRPFYYAFIGFPTGTAMPFSFTQCSTTVGRSTDNAQTFTTFSNATLCDNNNGPTCFPDQEHIAADPFNAAAGGDQVYSTWRNFSGGNCDNISGPAIPSLVCSQDNGATWSGTTVINGGSGDYPRISVGPDGFVYVVYHVGTTIMLDKYSSCANGLALQAGFPATVATFANVPCPVPGLDRCNSGNILTSHMVAVDDTNSNHVYVAFGTSTGGGNVDIMVIDSTDGGMTFPNPAVRINANTTGVRFMPWVCSVGGAARVGWYDRRAANGGASNDLTDYFCGAATGSGMALAAGTETNVSVNPDPQCASGWPCAPRASGDSDACTVQPQLAGVCCQVALNGSTCPMGMGSGNRCDFDTAMNCPMGETCQVGGGCPKYGDYNGVACAAGRIYTGWSSATAPPGVVGAPGGLNVFYSSKLAGLGPDLAISKSDSPDPVIAGTDLTYTITVDNNSATVPALNPTWTDTIPANRTFVSLSSPVGWTCMTPAVGGTGMVTCTTAFLGAGAMASFSLTVHVDPSTPDGSNISNTVAVSSDDADADDTDNMATSMTSVIAVADLAITKADSPDPVNSGWILTYTIEVVNNGPSDAQSVVVNMGTPTFTTFHSIVTPAGWACVTPPQFGSGPITCTTPTLPLNETATFIVRVRVNSGFTMNMNIECVVTISSATTDDVPENNSADAETLALVFAPAAGAFGLALVATLTLLVGIIGLRRGRARG